MIKMVVERVMQKRNSLKLCCESVRKLLEARQQWRSKNDSGGGILRQITLLRLAPYKLLPLEEVEVDECDVPAPKHEAP